MQVQEHFDDIAKDLPSVGYSQRLSYRFFKRLFDILLACLALLLLWPLMIILAVIIRIDSPGGAIFRQARLGLDGKCFIMYKFRSMVVDAERNGPVWAKENDDRTTKVGMFIRKYRLDELPQIFNIIRGDMSFVGPRPERAVFYDKFDEYIDGYRKRMLVKPGLTGWAQVNGGYNLRPEKKIIYDIEYIRNYSILMDIKIMFMTCKVIFTGQGAR